MVLDSRGSISSCFVHQNKQQIVQKAKENPCRLTSISFSTSTSTSLYSSRNGSSLFSCLVFWAASYFSYLVKSGIKTTRKSRALANSWDNGGQYDGGLDIATDLECASAWRWMLMCVVHNQISQSNCISCVTGLSDMASGLHRDLCQKSCSRFCVSIESFSSWSCLFVVWVVQSSLPECRDPTNTSKWFMRVLLQVNVSAD